MRGLHPGALPYTLRNTFVKKVPIRIKVCACQLETSPPIYGTGLQVLFSHLIQFFRRWDRQPSAGFNFGVVNFACIFQCSNVPKFLPCGHQISKEEDILPIATLSISASQSFLFIQMSFLKASNAPFGSCWSFLL